MKGPYGFERIEDCQTCKLRGNGFFCQWPPAALKDLAAVTFISAYPQAAVLCMEQQAPRGMYVLCQSQPYTFGELLFVGIKQNSKDAALMQAQRRGT